MKNGESHCFWGRIETGCTGVHWFANELIKAIVLLEINQLSNQSSTRHTSAHPVLVKSGSNVRSVAARSPGWFVGDPTSQACDSIFIGKTSYHATPTFLFFIFSHPPGILNGITLVSIQQ